MAWVLRDPRIRGPAEAVLAVGANLMRAVAGVRGRVRGHFWWHLGDLALASGRSSSLTDRKTPLLTPAAGIERHQSDRPSTLKCCYQRLKFCQKQPITFGPL
jgi:hypothetical protein